MQSVSVLGLIKDITDILRTPVRIGMTRDAARKLRVNRARRRLDTSPASPSMEKEGQQLKAKPGQFAMEGVIAPGKDAVYSINAHDFLVDDETWVIGNIEFGAKAIVKGSFVSGERHATSILVLK